MSTDAIQWETIFNAIGQPAIILDRDHRVVAANNASISLTGKPQNEIVGKFCFEVFHHSESKEPAEGCPMKKMLQSGVMETTDMEIEAMGGTFFVSCTPIPAADGSIDKVIHIATCITARKELELKQVAESAFNRAIIHNASEGLCVGHVVPEFPYVQFTIWNERMTAITGYTMEEINLCGWYQALFNYPETREHVEERLQKIKDGEGADISGKSWRITTKQGEERVVGIWASLLQLDDSEHVLSFLIDVTEHRKIERALLEQQNFTSSLIQNSTVAMFVLDTNHHVKVWNKACENLTGFSYSDLVGSDNQWKAFYEFQQPTLADVIIDGDFNRLPKLYTHVTKSIYAVNGYKAEGWFENINGKDRYFMIEAAPIYDSHGIMTHVLESISDLTESKTLEQQFQQTQKLESLGVLAGGIAHDFNNILAAIIGYCSLVRMDYESAESHIPEIEKAAERAAELCRQMLTYAGKAQFTQHQINMPVLVDEMVKMLKSTLNQNAVITLNISHNIPVIKGDASQLRQIVMNLVINASEAISDAQGEIRVSLATATIIAGQSKKDHLGKTIPAGQYVCLEVSDTGCGMDEDTKQRVFEPFYTTKFTGRGLGMSAVLGIIAAHMGSLQLFSQPGQGSTFKVYLPVQISDSVEYQSHQHAASSAAWQDSGTVLLVEDEEQIKFIARIMLIKLGFTVIEASNGKEALELYSENAADITLVITDMGMPIMDGYALFRELKKLNPLLPIIISSGFGNSVVTSMIAREDIAGLVGKPYNFDQLRDVLKMVLKNNS